MKLYISKKPNYIPLVCYQDAWYALNNNQLIPLFLDTFNTTIESIGSDHREATEIETLLYCSHLEEFKNEYTVLSS